LSRDAPPEHFSAAVPRFRCAPVFTKQDVFGQSVVDWWREGGFQFVLNELETSRVPSDPFLILICFLSRALITLGAEFQMKLNTSA
jgi:hypothetical protein